MISLEMAIVKKPEPPKPARKGPPKPPPPIPRRPPSPAPPSEPPMELSDDELISIPPPPPSVGSDVTASIDFDARPESVSASEVELVDPHPPAPGSLPALNLDPDVTEPILAAPFPSKKVRWLAVAGAAFAVGVGGGYKLLSGSPTTGAPAPEIRAFNVATAQVAKAPEMAPAIHAAAVQPDPTAEALPGSTAPSGQDDRGDDLVQPASRVSVASHPLPTPPSPGPASVPQAAPPSAPASPSPARSPGGDRPLAKPSAPLAETATEPVARAAPPPPPVTPSPMFGALDLNAEFDRNAAMEALRNASNAALACRGTGAVEGGVRVAVTFARTGQVADAHVDGDGNGTPLGDCVVSKFRSLHVPPFRGSSMTVRRTVTF